MEKTISVDFTLAELKLIQFILTDFINSTIGNHERTEQLQQFGTTKVGRKVDDAIALYRTAYSTVPTRDSKANHGID